MEGAQFPWWTFRIFFIFFCSRRGKGGFEMLGGGGGGVDFLMQIPGGGLPGGGGGEGLGGCLRRIGELGRGAKYFVSGPKRPPSFCYSTGHLKGPLTGPLTSGHESLVTPQSDNTPSLSCSSVMSVSGQFLRLSLSWRLFANPDSDMCAKFGDQYDWTTGGPYDGNECCVIPRARPSRPLCCAHFHRSGSKGALDFQGRRGIASVVRWNLRPVIFGADRYEAQVQFSDKEKQ